MHPVWVGTDVHLLYSVPQFVAFFVAIYSPNDACFVLQPTKFCGKIFLRRKWILIDHQGCIFYFGKNALSLLHPLVVVTLASRQFEAVHFSGV